MTWRALSLSQPYASAIAIGPKRIENRSTPIARKVAPCWIGLHAAKSWCHNINPRRWAEVWPESPPIPTDGSASELFPRGAMLGAMFVDWVAPFPTGDLSQRAAAFSDLPARDRLLLADDWAFGPWCLHIAEVRLLPEPIPCRGMLGLWAVPPDVAAALDANVPEPRR